MSIVPLNSGSLPVMRKIRVQMLQSQIGLSCTSRDSEVLQHGFHVLVDVELDPLRNLRQQKFPGTGNDKMDQAFLVVIPHRALIKLVWMVDDENDVSICTHALKNCQLAGQVIGVAVLLEVVTEQPHELRRNLLLTARFLFAVALLVQRARQMDGVCQEQIKLRLVKLFVEPIPFKLVPVKLK